MAGEPGSERLKARRPSPGASNPRACTIRACSGVYFRTREQPGATPWRNCPIDRGYFSGHAEALQDIARTGFWPTTYVSETSPELPLHYHDYDIIGYVLEGSTYLLDADSNRVEIAAGDRLNIPKGAWHAEGEVTERVVYVVSVSAPVPFMEALMPKEPKGPLPLPG